MKHLVLLGLLWIIVCAGKAGAQGCVAIRSQSCSGNFVTGSNDNALLYRGDLFASVGYRHFKSFRHFRGSEEEVNRVEDGTQVINHFDGFDLGLTYGLTDRWSLTVIAPFTINDRSSLYEHYGNDTIRNPEQKRFHTQSAGLGDMRLTGSFWILEHKHKGNVSVGATVKFPTGKPDVTDEFHKLDEDGVDYTIIQPVDQSIQLGDGAFGVGLEVNGYQIIHKSFSLYYNASYLAEPKNVNETLRRANSDPEDPYSYYSCPDQYALRVGALYYPTDFLSIGLGGRVEGIPSSDLFGESEGFRRPGYVISVEPGVSYVKGRFGVSLNVPVALVRNRTANTLDKIRGTHGDAAFADYVINATVTYLIPGHRNMEMDPIDIFE